MTNKPSPPTVDELIGVFESLIDHDYILPRDLSDDFMEATFQWASTTSTDQSDEILKIRMICFQCGIEMGMRIMHARSNPK